MVKCADMDCVPPAIGVNVNAILDGLFMLRIELSETFIKQIPTSCDVPVAKEGA